MNTKRFGGNSGRFKARFGSFDTLIFLHIPKTAGTTLRGIVERQYRHFGICRAYDPSERAEKRRLIEAMPLEKIRKIGLLEGHIEFGWHTLFPQKTVYITMLREPIDRVVSQYYYIREDSSHRLHNAVRGGAMDIEEYLRKRLNVYAINGQTYWLSGGSYSDGQSSQPEDALQKAKENIEGYFPAIGIQERFDESLILLKRVFRWRWVYYSRRKVTASRPKVEAMPDRIIRAIREFNQLDIDLYDYARRRFEDLVQNENAAFKAEVARFRLANRTYGKFISPLLASDPHEMMRDANSVVRSMIRIPRSEPPATSRAA